MMRMQKDIENKDIETVVAEFQDNFNQVKKEIQKVIVGQESVIQNLLLCLLADGHVLLEGLPGLGKTRLVITLSQVLELSFNRIQFTPDLMPGDITGTEILVESSDGKREFQFQKGSIFAQVILADEINRATPRTQSALLEAMQEHTVTVAGKSYKLEEPFLVVATQNPLEMEGTYRLPEAQLDRFTFKLIVTFPKESEMGEILKRTTGTIEPKVNKILNADKILEMRKTIRQVPVASHVEKYMIKLVRATHPDNEEAPDVVKRFVYVGSSIRGLQAITLTAKVLALVNGRYNVAFDDVNVVVYPSLRHRILLNFEGEAEGIKTDTIIDEILRSEKVKREK